ncbi:hypothetical protein DICPUDRAFT_31087 [Dictyostelium purpureum]|uniref:Radical SAM core domain-containing protein n=1 Tax=Dictyostelium purpureum TaxID=5786 RepID=F0ZGM0_DICPU|nr:uncharacterized protein DICPUDRAFT_31087 [Dictyostelium purpureum]EGC36910.1 hypothetical protein DICPUDRAFT_31087 [Dictyostelium purpureum]|eukprot:XP_003286553.1 hypothetical protein DICPUDRAFT_31087 [Dictyostelium purpureum]
MIKLFRPLTKNIVINSITKSPTSIVFINNNNNNNDGFKNKRYFTTNNNLENNNSTIDKNSNNIIDKNKILTDKFNRHHTYLRISLIDTCNLKCLYCHPEEGFIKQQQDKLLTAEEIIRLSKLFVSAGVNKIRFTGGEPLVRKEIDKIIEEVGKIKGIEKIGITTNGILLNRKLENMYKSGVNLFNISLDTLDPKKFMLITKRLGWERVMKSIEETLKLDNVKVKINCVVMKDLNDMEINDFVEMTRNKPVEIRFIEMMPFTGNKWSDQKFVSYQDMIKIIKEKFPTFEKYTEEEANNTSKTYHVPGFKGKIGFITSMSEHFCSSCNRLRITADGNIKVCLFDNAEVSLRDQIRNGATDEDLLKIINAAVLKKKASHAGMYEISKNENRPMILIGG